MIIGNNPKAQYLVQKEDIDRAMRDVLDRGYYVLGKEVAAFEREFAEYIGSRFAIGVGNGTDAIQIALRALDIGSGDEVITVSHTAVATVAAIELAGATPVLVDVDPNSFTIDPQLIETAITKRTKAIVPVHLYGHPVMCDDLFRIALAHNIPVVEDCAQSHGARYKGKTVGSLGTLGCFSFYPTKNLGALGDGGIIVTDSEALYQRCRGLREYGWKTRYISDYCGLNSRLDELQAAILRVKLRKLDEYNQSRRRLADRLTKTLQSVDVILPSVADEVDHVFHLYVVRTKNRDRILSQLIEKGIAALVHYPKPIHLQPAYLNRVRLGSSLKATEAAANEVLSLPISPEMSDADLDIVARELKAAIGS